MTSLAGFRRLVVGLAAAVLMASSWAQAHRDQLIKLATEGSEQEAGQRMQAYLSTLAPDEAFAAEVDLWAWSRKDAKIITRAQYARAMLDTHLRYLPNAEVAIDYWRYVVMIAAKLERGEIQQEEYDYLEGRKIAQAKAAQREADQQERLHDAQQRALAAPRAPQTSPIGEAMMRFGQTLRERSRSSQTDCVTMGARGNCYTR